MPKNCKAIRRRRWMLWKAQDYLCAGCGKRIPENRGFRSPLKMTIDEVVPRSKGGRRVLSNQLVMHRVCNLTKADRMPTGCEKIWLALVDARLRKMGRI